MKTKSNPNSNAKKTVCRNEHFYYRNWQTYSHFEKVNPLKSSAAWPRSRSSKKIFKTAQLSVHFQNVIKLKHSMLKK